MLDQSACRAAPGDVLASAKAPRRLEAKRGTAIAWAVWTRDDDEEEEEDASQNATDDRRCIYAGDRGGNEWRHCSSEPSDPSTGATKA
ncbi:hypothetical protein C0992_012482 [Termitomyces sp. T32_za158]|nr:hypothetical protein C0992_012482 [Termitomyces sp. T32_za158]